MRRRDFITMLGGAVVGWPLAARAQHGAPDRRVGVLSGGAEDDSDLRVRIAAFVQALAQLGWTRATTCGSTCVGEKARSTPFVNKRQN